MNLTSEQNNFIEQVKLGHNVLVDACVGSGKTTAIQALCDALPTSKSILYLTYNKLLKIDARNKIKNRNAFVTNYHGFAYSMLRNAEIRCGISDLIQTFNRCHPPVGHYDILVLDEYQDIDQEISEMLLYIKEQNPGLQIAAVGDMKQKIYDKTTLDIEKFIDQFVEKRIDMEFTKCFRLNNDWAEMLGRIWQKKINGVNEKCSIRFMRKAHVVKYLAEKDPSEILCLGKKTGGMTDTLNTLEARYPEKFNKNTVYATISEQDAGATQPNETTAIFTTYDSSKGLERKTCVVFDFDEGYWLLRLRMPNTKYEILRNIFLVAASRGKEEIIFVRDDDSDFLSEESLSTPSETSKRLDNMQISSMFDFKYKEDIEDCFALLKTTPVEKKDRAPIAIENHDGLIDLSPCIGIYQEASYFKGYDIDRDFALLSAVKNTFYDPDKYTKLEDKILYLVASETEQNRYIKQVRQKLVEDSERKALRERLNEEFTPDEIVQQECEIQFADSNKKFALAAAGIADVVKDHVVYELKFVHELQHEHYLQCACYMIAMNLETGILWNVRTNEMQKIEIKDRKKFMDLVTTAITKHQLNTYTAPLVKEEWRKKQRMKQVV